MSFSPSFLDEIRTRVPLSSVVSARVRMLRAGREFKGCCPFHHEKTPSFYVNDDKQFYHCFGCGAHGDVIGFLMRHDRLSFPEAVEQLAGMAGLPMPVETPEDRAHHDVEKKLYAILDRATAWFEAQLFEPHGKAALAYLKKRGLGDEAIGRFRLGYAPADGQALLSALGAEGFSSDDLAAVGLAKKTADGKAYSFFRDRVLFPVGDRRGRTVAFGGRVLGNGEPKYLNSPDHALFKKGSLLYGLSRARAALAQGQPLIVVEGYMDVITLVEAGYSGAVAPLGTALTEDQMQALWRLLPPMDTRDPSRDYSPVLCFDGDQAGQRAAARAIDRALPLLSPANTFRIATLSGAKDPDELIRQEGRSGFDSVLSQSLPMIDALWQQALSGRRLQTPEDRAAFMSALRAWVRQIKDQSLRALYGNEFKNRLADFFQGQAKKGRTQGGGQEGGLPRYVQTRLPPRDGHKVREKILLAFMVNHPALFDEFGEAFMLLDLKTPAYRALRDDVASYFLQGCEAPPTTEDIRRALMEEQGHTSQDGGKGAALRDVLSPSMYIGAAKAARPEAPLEEARQGWQAIWKMMEQEQVENDYARACAQYRADGSPESEARVKALRERLAAFRASAS
ncbi:MAG: DNA primase [Alphaproteobacteria bacterium]|nr:DNA primase [Alphaproteobacteria bacterium]